MSLPGLIRDARKRLLQMHFEAKVGHLGGNLSCLDALMVLHHQVMGPDDLFVLSKGHSAGALYITLWSKGLVSEEQLRQFHKDNTLIAGHPAAHWHPGIRFATGSLGHGLGLANGHALNRKLTGKPGRTFVLMSDGEWQEGSCWEGLIFAAHQGLKDLCIVIDANGLQGFGSTAEVAGMADLAPRLRTFHVDVQELDGHDSEALAAALKAPSARPKVLVLKTVKGKGVSFMQDKMEWHYLPLDEAHYKRAMEEQGA
jgi:transketolase